MSFVSIRSTVAPAASIENLRKVWERRSQYKAAAASGVRLDRRSAHGSHFDALDKRLYDWFLLLSRWGRKRIPFTISLLQEKARRIGEELGLDGFGASRGFVQAWARHHNLASVVLHGSGGSVDIGEAEKRMSDIRAQLQDFEADKIFNMDETGLFYRCLPNRSFVPADQRRVARGTKAMKAKERVTLVLACNATGARKVPVSLIGRAVRPLCFRPDGCACPLPYFSQKNSWMDASVFKRWVFEVFWPYVRSFTTDKVALIVDNLASHDDFSDDQLLLIALPPNTTAVFQPLDAGVIQALKMRYKKRFLAVVVRYLDAGSDAPSPSSRATVALANTGRTTMLDVARIIADEWADMTPESLARCWLKARCLPAPHEADITRLHADYHGADAPEMSTVVADIALVLRRVTLTEGLFPGTGSADVESGVSSWLVAENDADFLSDTIDEVLSGDASEEDDD